MNLNNHYGKKKYPVVFTGYFLYYWIESHKSFKVKSPYME